MEDSFEKLMEIKEDSPSIEPCDVIDLEDMSQMNIQEALVEEVSSRPIILRGLRKWIKRT